MLRSVFFRIPFVAIAAAAAVGCGQRDSGGSSSSGPTPSPSCTAVQGLTNLVQGVSPLPGNFGPSAVVSDGAYVYFDGPNALYRVPVAGGPAETVYSGAFTSFFAANGGTVAWVQGSFSDPASLGVVAKIADGLHSATLPTGVVPVWGTILVDSTGAVFFETNRQSGGYQTWRWDPSSPTPSEMAGVGAPDAGTGTNLYWADRGQIFWADVTGIYATDTATGASKQLAGSGATEFGTLVGVDASNLYGAGSICPRAACPFTISGVSRNGGAPFVAYQSPNAYRTERPQADDSGLYWIDWQTGIYHAVLSKGTPAELIHQWTPSSGSSIPSGFALDACNLYWAEGDQTGGLRLMAIPK